MNSEYFIEKIFHKNAHHINGIVRFLSQLPGRKPWPKDIKISKWYNALSDQDKEMVKLIMSKSIDQALFSFFCILDHVGFIEDTEEKTTFELYAVKNGERVLLNDPKKEELHNIYNSFSLSDADKS